MPATFHPELKAAPRQDGTRAIRIRITKFRKHAYYNTGKYVLASQWNPKPSTKLHNYVLRHDDAPQYNNAIKSAISGLEQFADKLPAGTAADIKAAYENHLNPKPEAPKPEQGFFAFFQEYIERIRAVNAGTAIGYQSILNHFASFAGRSHPDEYLLSPAVLHAYRAHLLTVPLNVSTIRLHMVILKTIYKNGILEGRVQQLGNPFKSVRVTVPEKTLNRPTAEQIVKLINYKTTWKCKRRAQYAALLQYFLHGARISEVLTLEWDKHIFPDKVVYLPVKRASKLKTIPRGPLLNWVLDQLPRKSRFVLPFIREKDMHLFNDPIMFINMIKSRSRNINLNLKKIDKELELGLGLSTHMMRRAFLDSVMDKTNDLVAAQSLAGHSSSKTTEAYLKGPATEKLNKLSETIYAGFSVPDSTGKHKENNPCRTVQFNGVIKIGKT